MNSIKQQSLNTYIADGIEGFFKLTKKTGGFTHIRHVITETNESTLVGSIPNGWNVPNKKFNEMVVQAIEKYVNQQT